MFELDFNGRQADIGPTSYENKLFMDEMRKGVHQQDGHYMLLPLLLKDEKVKLHNNRDLAAQG